MITIATQVERGRQRRTLTPLFGRKMVARFAPAMVAAAVWSALRDP